MKFRHTLTATCLGLLSIAPAFANVPADAAAKLGDELTPADAAAKLGDELTPMGAERAGNAAGTIPAWDGKGIGDLPANFDVTTGIYVDPFQADEPLYSVTGENWEEHADKLTEGTKALLQKYGSDGYRMDVYPTRRSYKAPQWIYDNTRKNATGASLVDDGQKIEGAEPGVPFPIPQSGLEAMWNHMVRWEGTHFQYKADSYYVDSRGKPVLSTSAKIAQEYPMYNLDKDYGTDKRSWLYLRSDYSAPSRRAGEIIMVHEPGADYTDGKGRKAWQYLTGQRRVRRAPAIAFDTPSPAVAGSGTYDDAFVYNGSPERYTWKLVGKKEVLAPYNAYKFVFETPVEEALGEKFFKPEYIRWELRRVWVVEATLKEGQRHIYNKRTYYLDEDSWSALAGEMYDGRDNLWRVNYGYMTPLYDVPAGGLIAYSGYDLLKGIYYINTKPVPGTFTNVGEQKSVKFWSPQSMTRTGIR